MYLIVVRLRAHPASGDSPCAAQVKELVLAEVRPADRVEHVRVRTGPDRIDMAILLLAECEPEALLRARAVCERVVAATLPGWALHPN